MNGTDSYFQKQRIAYETILITEGTLALSHGVQDPFLVF